MKPLEITAMKRAQLGAMTSLLPAPTAALQVTIVEPLRVLALRCLPGDEAEPAAVVGPLPGPGRCSGSDPLLVWRSPSEWLMLASQDEPADRLLRALPPGAAAAQAFDLSAGTIVFELKGSALDALLSRLTDASVPLSQPGQAARARLADVAIVAMRREAERLWLLADRANDHYLAHWLAHAAAAQLTSQ